MNATPAQSRFPHETHLVGEAESYSWSGAGLVDDFPASVGLPAGAAIGLFRLSAHGDGLLELPAVPGGRAPLDPVGAPGRNSAPVARVGVHPLGPHVRLAALERFFACCATSAGGRARRVAPRWRCPRGRRGLRPRRSPPCGPGPCRTSSRSDRPRFRRESLRRSVLSMVPSVRHPASPRLNTVIRRVAVSFFMVHLSVRGGMRCLAHRLLSGLKRPLRVTNEGVERARPAPGMRSFLLTGG